MTEYDFFKDQTPEAPEPASESGSDFFADTAAPVPVAPKGKSTKKRYTHSDRKLPPPEQRAGLSHLKDMTITGPIAGAQKGLIGLAGLPGTVEELGRAGINLGLDLVGSQKRVGEEPALPNYADVKDAYERNLWEIDEPDTHGGKLFSEMAEWGAGGTGASAVKAPVAGAKFLAGNSKGAVSALREAARADRAGATLGMIGGGVTGGIDMGIDNSGIAAGTGLAVTAPLAFLLNRRGHTPAKLLEAYGGVKNITPPQWDEALRREVAAKAMGVPLLGPESIDSDQLARLAGDIGTMPGAAPIISQFVEPRFSQVRGATDALAENIAGKPASVLRAQRPDELAGAISKKSAEGIDTPRRQAAAKSQPHFEAIRTQDVPPDVVTKFLDELPVPRKGQEPSAVERIADHVKKRLTYEVEVPDPADATKTITKRVPETNLGRIHDALMEFKDNTRLAPGVQLTDESVKSRQAWREFWGKKAGAPGKLVGFQDDLRQVNPDYESAWAAYDAVVPARRAWEGSRSNVLADADAKARKTNKPGADAFTKINNELFGNKERIPTAAEFRDATKALLQEDPKGQLLADLTSQALLRNLEKASKATQGTDAPKTVGANLAKVAQGSQDSAKRALNNEVLATIARARGMNVQQLQSAWNNTMDIFQRTGKIPGVGSPTSQRAQIANVAKGNLKTQASDLLASPASAGQKLVNVFFSDLGQAGENAVYEKIARAFADPNSPVEAIQKLAKLGTSPENKMRALQVLLQGQREAAQGEDDE